MEQHNLHLKMYVRIKNAKTWFTNRALSFIRVDMPVEDLETKQSVYLA
jgi:hypothetical protein